MEWLPWGDGSGSGIGSDSDSGHKYVSPDGTPRIAALFSLFVSGILLGFAEGIAGLIATVYRAVGDAIVTLINGLVGVMTLPFDLNATLWGQAWAVAGAETADFGIFAFAVGIVVIVAVAWAFEQLIAALTEVD